MFNAVRPGPAALAGVQPSFSSATLGVANLEVPITDQGSPTQGKSKKELKARTQFILRASPKHAKSLQGSGIGFVTLANNHCMDYGSKGLVQELSMLDSLHILHAGAGMNVKQADAPTLFSGPNGVRIGFVSVMAFATTAALRKTTPATVNSPGVSVLNLGGSIGKQARAKLKARMGAAHALCDVLVVGIHWGTERKTMPNPYQVALGRALIDAGVDVVWGNHPHVIEAAEIYRGKPILYSVGNLISALPSETGLFRLTFDGSKLTGADYLPGRVSKGKVFLIKGAAQKIARRRFAILCAQFERRYRSKDSLPLAK
jgi:poly-gamma-glutamate synthesis protein (capsule biosynthesis protein)